MTTARQIQFALFTLLLIGLIFIFNSSVVHSQNVFGSPQRFSMLHLGWTFLGLIGYFVFSKLKLKTLIDFSPVLYVIILVFLFILAIWGLLPCSMSPSFVPCINNANRWIVLNPEPLPQIPFVGELSFQPSELAKIGIILFLAYKFKDLVGKKSEKKSFNAYFLYTSLFAFLVLLEPNMSTGIIIFAIGTAMYFSTGQSLKPFYLLTPILIIFLIIMVVVTPYRRERLLTYITKSTVATETDEGYQVKQVKIALGSGGLLGVGFGNSRQKYTYLPEVSTDSIFAVIGEELGFVGASAVLGIFLLLILKGITVSKNTSNIQEKLVAIGITMWIGVQFLVHMLANAGLIPYTGVTLPFISYGGSSLLFSMMAMGILVSISRANE